MASSVSMYPPLLDRHSKDDPQRPRSTEPQRVRGAPYTHKAGCRAVFVPQTNPQPLWASHPRSKDRTPGCRCNTHRHTPHTLHSKKKGIRPHAWNPAFENTTQVQRPEQSRAQSPAQSAIPWMCYQEAPGWSMQTHNGNQVAIRRVKDVLRITNSSNHGEFT